MILPWLFNLVLSLGNGGMMHDLGAMATGGVALPEPVDLVVGRSIMLFAFCEVLTGLLRILVAGRLARDWRFHALLLGSAVHAAMTPHIADLPQIAGALGPLQPLVAIVAAALAQAGLWAIVFIVTGLTIDALNGTPPTFAAAYAPWRSGAVKGGIYGGVFMAIVVAGAAVLRLPGVTEAIRGGPILPAVLGCALLFPLAQTVISSADGTPPFFGAIEEQLSPSPVLCARGGAGTRGGARLPGRSQQRERHRSLCGHLRAGCGGLCGRRPRVRRLGGRSRPAQSHGARQSLRHLERCSAAS